MFKQIWKNLKKTTGKSTKNNLSFGDNSLITEKAPSLSDSDYEFLWIQLLEGVAHGWHSQKIVNFFKDLGERGKEDLWLGWLNRFEEKLLTTSSPNQQLASRMLLFSQKTQEYASLKEISDKSYQIGRLILSQQAGSLIWEYDGPDLFDHNAPKKTEDLEVSEEVSFTELIPPPTISPETSQQEAQKDLTPPQIPLSQLLPNPEISYEGSQIDLFPQEIPPQPSTVLQTNTEIFTPTVKEESRELTDPWQENPSPPSEVIQPRVETLTLDELIERLKTDPNLLSQVASQLGVNSNDIEEVITTLKQKMQISDAPVATEVTEKVEESPETIEESAETTEESPEFEKLFYQGLEKADQGEMKEAIALWDQALALNPNVSAIWHNRGSALGHLGLLDEAIISFDKAIEINPKDYQAWNDRGNAFYNLQQWEKALFSWDQSLTIRGDFTQAWYSRGCALEHLNRLEEALISYNKAIELKPDLAMAITRLNNLQQKMSQ
jgi:Flp pilus assembly protein TadD